MEFLVISIVNIFKWLLPTKTESVSFYSLSHVLSDSVINFSQVQYQNLTFFCHHSEIPGVPKKVHNFVQVLFSFETRYVNKLFHLIKESLT